MRALTSTSGTHGERYTVVVSPGSRPAMVWCMAVEVPPGGTRGAKGPPSGPVGRVLMRIARIVHRVTGSKMGGRPLLYLQTVGAKSGEPRAAVVMPFPEGDDAWLIVASK